MNTIIDRLITYYSEIKLTYFITTIFLVFFLGYIMIFHKKIINFYEINHKIHFSSINIISIKKKQQKFLNIGYKNNIKNDNLFENHSINQLLNTIQKLNLVEYQVDNFSEDYKNNLHIKTLELSLKGDYISLIHWLFNEVPEFCFLKKITLVKTKDRLINLIAQVEVYEF